ncbi:metal ABC transporter solute-binding protein, Zn/Mn family [Thalassotalea sp. ND16A]|uniref:metal ABC transporter solute-binding protein, Zn/Mn family n=1 Tax=Thalassotalea sp. ND16A TaxID=1535422 RepID=UPI000519F29B
MRINFKQALLLAGSLLAGALLPAKAELNIFACEPEYAALAAEITGESANIFSATTAQQDPHFIQARPSLIAKMRRADLVICAGADLEIGWLPMLQMKSNNRQVQTTDKGLFYAADHVENLDIPVTVDRSMGDVHTLGNPHVHLDPVRVGKLATALTAKLIDLDAANRELYQQNLASFSQRWQQATVKWQQQAKPLAGMKVITYHASFRYLLDFLAMEKVADLEPKPGMPPSSSHLRQLLDIVDEQQVQLVLYTAYQDAKAAKWLAEKAGVVRMQLPYTVGGDQHAQDLFSLMDRQIAMLLSAKRN